MASDPPIYARLEVPPWLWGGDPDEFLAQCGYHSRSDVPGESRVQPKERYLKRRPNLVRCKTVAGPGSKRTRFHDLAFPAENAEPPRPSVLDSELERRQLRAHQAPELLAVINYERLALYATPIAELPQQAEKLAEFLRTLPLDGEPDTHPFAKGGLFAIEVDPVLHRRLKLPAVWLRAAQDERMGGGDLSHLRGVPKGDLTFGSAAGLYDGTYTLDGYVTPLLAALSPGIWGFNVPRPYLQLIFSFGRCVAGTTGDASEMLQLVTTPGSDKPTPSPDLPAGADGAATEWWAHRLNDLFGVLSDLSVFTDGVGSYQAASHLTAILTVEQVFRRTASMQLAVQDTHTRRLQMFSVLDTMQNVTGRDLLSLCRLGHAEAALAKVRDSMGEGARDLLLPRAQDAVDALRELQDGFFIQRQLGHDHVQLRLTGGQLKSLSPEEAAARYLKVLRDATHGHGGKRLVDDTTAALLAQHNGYVPHDIGLLAYLYLLDMLCNPQRLRRCLYRPG